jgi:hypothetical protein
LTAKFLLALLGLAALVGGSLGYAAYRTSRTPPTSRLALDAYYPAMPPDARHHYLNLPLDSAIRMAFFLRGLHAPGTEALLVSPPVS